MPARVVERRQHACFPLEARQPCDITFSSLGCNESSHSAPLWTGLARTNVLDITHGLGNHSRRTNA
jgi:hypothetical protein